jgi:hypothetical protein
VIPQEAEMSSLPVKVTGSVLTTKTLTKHLASRAPVSSLLTTHPTLLHTAQGLVDFATLISAAVGEGKIKTQVARELRHLAEFSYTVQMAQNMGGTQVNYVQQLIQLAGGPEVVGKEGREFRKVVNAK